MRRFARDPNTGMLVPETPSMFYARDLSPIQVTTTISLPLSLSLSLSLDSSVLEEIDCCCF
jgi:hypothetical protein